MAYVAVGSEAVVLLLVTCCFLVLPLWESTLCPSSIAIILMGKKEVVALLSLFF